MIRASIHGRLGADPIVRTTRTDKVMTTASIAVNVAKPNDAAVIEWINLVAFGNVGELLARHVRGDVITVMGSMTKSTYTRDGKERSSWGVLAETLLSTRAVRTDKPKESRASNRSSRPRGIPKRAPYRPQATSHVGDLPNDDVTDLYT